MKKTIRGTKTGSVGESSGLGDWRDETLAKVRKLVLQAVPDAVEETKWRKPSNPAGVPVWSHGGILCTGETYKQVVKVTFAKGASLDDPAGLFNASLEGNTRRAIDLREGDRLDGKAFKALVRAAAALNASSSEKKVSAKANAGKTSSKSVSVAGKASAKKAAVKKTAADPSVAQPKLLSGGNPQIAKANGDAPVQAYIDAMPDWKRDVGRRLDALVVKTVPDVRKAVRWNSPFYGVEGQGWFLSYHCFAKYVKVTFLRGAALCPLPPVESKDPNVRYFHIHEDDDFDEARLTNWIEQAAATPGDPLF